MFFLDMILLPLGLCMILFPKFSSNVMKKIKFVTEDNKSYYNRLRVIGLVFSLLGVIAIIFSFGYKI